MRYVEDVCFNLMLRPWLRRVESIDQVLYYYRQHPQSAMHAQKKNAYLSFNIIPLTCKAWRDQGAVALNEVYLLSYLLEQISIVATPWHKKNEKLYKKYGKKILSSFGSDVYNAETAQKLSKRSARALKAIERLAYAS